MIYIFKTITLPCTLCKESCKAIPTLCKESCKCVGKLCDAIRDCWAPVTHSPLAGYVLGTWLVMILSIAAFGVSLSQVSCQQVQMHNLINIALALSHMVMARYLQWRIVDNIKKKQGEEAMEKMSHKDIADQAIQVALYDVGFCLYFFFFWGAWGYNCYGIATFKDCNGTGPAWAATAAKILYGVVVANYFIFWFCCQACCGAKEKRSEQRAQKAQAQQAQAQQIGLSP